MATEQQILDELEEIRTRRLKILQTEEVSSTINARQVIRPSLERLAALDAHEDYLRKQLTRLQRGGIRVRYGVVR